MKSVTIGLILFASMLFFQSPIQGEIESVTVNWDAVSCTANCAKLLEKRFKESKDVAEVQVNPSTGVATLKWKPDAKFTYTAVKRVMQMVGAGLDDIRVRVRGKVKDEGKNVALYSLGDGTRFLLVSPNITNPGTPIYKENPTFMVLTPELRKTILDDAKDDKVMIFEGALYKPWSVPFLMIVIERLQVEKKS